MSYNIPILFLVFNRPETTAKVFNKIRSIKPKKLYVVADGPRKNNNNDIVNSNKVKDIIKQVDWPCKVKKLYRKENSGCRVSVSNGITWFFKHEKMGVILEDDCLPNNSFFNFCEKLLLKYEFDNRVMHISGNTFISDKIRSKYITGDYFFSKYPHISGWATWRRAWNLYNHNMSNYNNNLKKIIDNNNSLLEKLYWSKIFKLVYNNKINSWGYVWLYSIWENKGLSIQPKYNLVKNIGFGIDATHTNKIISGFSNYHYLKLKKHPLIVDSNKFVDSYISKYHYNISFLGLFLKLYNHFKLFLK